MSYVQGYFGTGASAGVYGVSQGGDETDPDGVILQDYSYDVAIGDFAGLTGLPTDLSTAANWQAFADALVAKSDELSSQAVYATVYALNLVGVGSDQDDTFTSYATVSARVYGGGGNDQMIDGYGTPVYFDGGVGDDTLTGGSGADTLIGGAGFDYVSYAGFGSAVNVNLVNGQASGGGGADSLSAIERVTGTSLDDVITGSTNTESLDGGDGADTIISGGGMDSVYGGDGADLISGAGAVLDGGAGADTITAGSGTASVTGDAGADVIFGSSGTLDGGGDGDTITGGGGDAIFGGAGDDVVILTAITPTVTGGFFDGGYNVLRLDFSATGRPISVQLHPEVGAPVGGSVNDDIGGGSSIIAFQVLGDSKLSPFADKLLLTDPIYGDAPTLGLIQALGGDDTVTGGSYAEHVQGGAGKDLLYGLGGADTLLGGSGADTIEGGDGDDSLNGGAGADTVSYASASAAVTVLLDRNGPQDTGGAGVDTLHSFTGVVGSAFDDLLHGNAHDDVLSGGQGRDRLFGGGGDDTLTTLGDGDLMSGGHGDDLYVFGYDAVRFLGSLGNLEIKDVIDLSAVALAVGQSHGGYDHFTEVAAFDGQAGEMIARYAPGDLDHADRTRFLIDIDGDGRNDLKLVVLHGDHTQFTNFIGVDTSELTT